MSQFANECASKAQERQILFLSSLLHSSDVVIHEEEDGSLSSVEKDPECGGFVHNDAIGDTDLPSPSL